MSEEQETEEYMDEQTGIRLLVKRDIPEHPLLSVIAPEGCTLSTEEINKAISRLFSMAGIEPQRNYV